MLFIHRLGLVFLYSHMLDEEFDFAYIPHHNPYLNEKAGIIECNCQQIVSLIWKVKKEKQLILLNWLISNHHWIQFDWWLCVLSVVVEWKIDLTMWLMTIKWLKIEKNVLDPIISVTNDKIQNIRSIIFSSISTFFEEKKRV